MNNRLKELRKHLNLNQSDFGKKIGITASAVSRLESGEIGFTEQTVKSICREFNVSYDWLKYGDGEMFLNLPETLVDEVVVEYGLDDSDRSILLGYLSLTPQEREILKKSLRQLLDYGDDHRA